MILTMTMPTEASATDAGPALRRSLEDSSQLAGCPLKATGAEWNRWRTATFTGARHELVMEAAETPALTEWLAAISDAVLPIDGHLLADLTVKAVRRKDGVAVITLDALTVENLEAQGAE